MTVSENLVLPSEVKTSPFAESMLPVEGPFAAHLEDYAKTQALWAEATQAACDANPAPVNNDPYQVGDTWYASGGEGVSFAPTVEMSQKHLGRIPLTSIGHKSQSPARLRELSEKSDLVTLTLRNGSVWSYGSGEEAHHALELETVLTEQALKAAESIAADKTLDPAMKLVWNTLLTSKNSLTQLDPGPFAAEAEQLLTDTKKRFISEQWVAVTDKSTLTVIELEDENVVQVEDGRLVAGPAHTITAKVEPSAKLKTVENAEFALFDGDELGLTPETSFRTLRNFAHPEVIYGGGLTLYESMSYTIADDIKRSDVCPGYFAWGYNRWVEQRPAQITALLGELQQARADAALEQIPRLAPAQVVGVAGELAVRRAQQEAQLAADADALANEGEHAFVHAKVA